MSFRWLVKREKLIREVLAQILVKSLPLASLLRVAGFAELVRDAAVMVRFSGEGLCLTGLRLVRELERLAVLVTTLRLPRMSDFFGDCSLAFELDDFAREAAEADRWPAFATEVDRLERA